MELSDHCVPMWKHVPGEEVAGLTRIVDHSKSVAADSLQICEQRCSAEKDCLALEYIPALTGGDCVLLTLPKFTDPPYNSSNEGDFHLFARCPKIGRLRFICLEEDAL